MKLRTRGIILLCAAIILCIGSIYSFAFAQALDPPHTSAIFEFMYLGVMLMALSVVAVLYCIRLVLISAGHRDIFGEP